jgi:hypothetical protein
MNLVDWGRDHVAYFWRNQTGAFDSSTKHGVISELLALSKSAVTF